MTVLVRCQPFVPDFSKALTMSHGWSLYWYTHPATVGVVHTVWAVLTIGFVVLAPDRWLGMDVAGSPAPTTARRERVPVPAL